MSGAKKKSLSVKLTQAILLACAAVTVGSMGLIRFENKGTEITYDEITVTDLCSDPQLLTVRSKNWEQIAADPLFISDTDLLHIYGVDETAAITAELARQFPGYSDDEIPDKIIYYRSGIMSSGYNGTSAFGNTTGARILLDTVPSYIYSTKYKKDEPLNYVPVARDGLVFITHKSNPVDSLTAEQLRMIYFGDITNWKEVGGNDEKITIYRRNTNSSAQKALEKLVLNGGYIMADTQSGYYTNEPFMHGATEHYERHAEYENYPASIGFTYGYYLERLYDSERIKILKIDGVYPDKDSITNGDYPFVTKYCAILTGDNTERMAKIRDYLLTDEGQRIIEMAGFCPVPKDQKEE